MYTLLRKLQLLKEKVDIFNGYELFYELVFYECFDVEIKWLLKKDGETLHMNKWCAQKDKLNDNLDLMRDEIFADVEAEIMDKI